LETSKIAGSWGQPQYPLPKLQFKEWVEERGRIKKIQINVYMMEQFFSN
jgi:hypothetical protein